MDDAGIKPQGSDAAWKATTAILALLLVLSMAENAILAWRVAGTATGTTALTALSDWRSSGPGAPSVTRRALGPPGALGPLVDVGADDAPVLGSATAKVEVVAFLDYECSFCARWHVDSFAQLRMEYISTGKVRFATRNYPLAFHPSARAAAIAANCVRALTDDNTFYRYHDALFRSEHLAEATLEREAVALGVDGKAFQRCTADASRSIAKKIDRDMVDGAAAGVTGTPTFFVNGRMLVGAQPYVVFKAAIDAELKRAGGAR